MLEHVLVPLDYSLLSERALPYAQHIVGPNGQISLISVLEEPVMDYVASMTSGSVPPIPEADRHARQCQAEDYLRQVTKQLGKSHPQVETYVEFGQPAEEIVDTARRLDVQAIVISTHGRTGLSRWMYGSVTQKVLSAAPCPVFVIPSRMPDTK